MDEIVTVMRLLYNIWLQMILLLKKMVKKWIQGNKSLYVKDHQDQIHFI